MSKYLHILIEVGPRFNKEEVKTVIQILIGLGLVIIGTSSLPIILKEGPYSWAFAGLVGSTALWYIAIRLSRRLPNDN